MTAELSVVLVNKFGLERLRPIMTSLAAQSIADRLELVVVSPFDPPQDLPSPFARVHYVQSGPIQSIGPPRAVGVQACSTPFLVFGEDHCFPGPGWAAALLGRLREGWTGVGPLIANHNPATWFGRADWLLNYGCFRAGEGGPVRQIPPHNSAYSTAALQALGPELPGLLQMDHHLQDRLLSAGGRLFQEVSVYAAHTNLSRPRAHWSSQFHGNRVYGATRADYHRWPAHRRMIYAAAFPLIATLRLVRVCPLVPGWRELPMVPLLAVACMVAAVGEGWGYLFGAGSSLRHRVDEELDRPSGVIAEERSLLLP